MKSFISEDDIEQALLKKLKESPFNYDDILLDIQTQFGTISQQPTANSQQPTANSQQVIFTVIILYFVIYILRTRAVSEFGVFSHFILWLLFFYAYLAVRQAYARCLLK